MGKSNKSRKPTILERLEFALVRAILGAVHLMPYRRRIAAMGWVLFGQRLDGPALLGIAMIVAGIVVIQVFSGTARH